MEVATIGVVIIALLGILADPGVRKVETKIGRGIVHVVTLGHK